MTEKCERMELLISKMLDGEVSSGEKEEISRHQAECRHCRDFYERHLQCSEFLAGSQEGLDLPACPVISKDPVRSSMPFYLKPAAAVMLLALFFCGGFLTGGRRALNNIPSYARVGVPAVWTKSSASLVTDTSQLSPLQDLISEYQLLIGEELGKEEVDWQKVRVMVETLGSLRTDLEILALHKGSLDQMDDKKGSPRETWHQMMGIKTQEKSL